MSWHGHLVGCGIQPFSSHRLCSRWCTCPIGLRPMSRWRQICGNSCNLYRLSSSGLQQYDRSQSRSGGFLHRLYPVSHNSLVAECDLQSQCHRISAYGCAFNAAVYIVPQQRRVCRIANCMRIVPLDGFQWDHKSQSRRGRFLSGLHRLPQHSGMDPGCIRSQQNPIPAHRSALNSAMLVMP